MKSGENMLDLFLVKNLIRSCKIFPLFFIPLNLLQIPLLTLFTIIISKFRFWLPIPENHYCRKFIHQFFFMRLTIGYLAVSYYKANIFWRFFCNISLANEISSCQNAKEQLVVLSFFPPFLPLDHELKGLVQVVLQF